VLFHRLIIFLYHPPPPPPPFWHGRRGIHLKLWQPHADAMAALVSLVSSFLPLFSLPLHRARRRIVLLPCHSELFQLPDRMRIPCANLSFTSIDSFDSERIYAAMRSRISARNFEPLHDGISDPARNDIRGKFTFKDRRSVPKTSAALEFF